MSTQTVIYNKVDNLLDNIDDFYICQGNNYINKVDYSLGIGIDINKFILVEWIDTIITSNNTCRHIEIDKLLEKLNLILIK